MSATPPTKPLHDPIAPPERDPPNKPMHDPPGDPTFEPPQPLTEPTPNPASDPPPEMPGDPPQSLGGRLAGRRGLPGRQAYRPLCHLGLAPTHRLADLKALELRVPEIEGLVLPSAMMRGAERFGLGPGFERGAVLPHRVGRIKRVILGFGAFKQVDSTKPGTLSKWLSRDSQTCSKAASDPLATRNRFMAINIG
jgi:hypothetical protein